ncbi:MAG TPA: DUF2381 family protein [Myxococcus sp.]|nr:DUF2381 family protein [Myxococcus sp.]
MLASRLLAVLACALVLAPGAEAAPEPSADPAGVRRIELRADVHAPPPEVRIRPGYSTTFFFDSPIQTEQVELEGRERFQRVGITGDHLALIPSSSLREGEKLRLRLRFRDGALPEFASLSLVVDRHEVEQQVELYRHPRPAESYRREVEELKEGMTRLQREVERLREAAVPAVGVEPLLARFDAADSLQYEPLKYQRLSSSIQANAFRGAAISLQGKWIALRFMLETGAEEADWTAAGASLVDARGRLMKTRPPWQPGPVSFEQEQVIVVMLEEGANLRAGRYTLKLWDDAGRTVTLEGVAPPAGK